MTELEYESIKTAILAAPDHKVRAMGLVAFNQVIENLNASAALAVKNLEALQDVRLNTKYLIFDLQATRAERDKLREKYEN